MSLFNSRFQYPHMVRGEVKLVQRIGGSAFLEFLFAVRKWRMYYIAALSRAVRLYSDKYSHLSFGGHIDLPENFVCDESRLAPRVGQIEGNSYSQAYVPGFEELPEEVRKLTLSFESILECFFASSINIGDVNIWRNFHVPKEKYSLNEEVFADAFHQDLVADQFNAQLFILLKDTTLDHGPFEYLSAADQMQEMDYYRRRDRKIPLSKSKKLTGKRGDYFLISTGTTLHRATNPAEGMSRDMLSIPFFPDYAGIGTPMAAFKSSK